MASRPTWNPAMGTSKAPTFQYSSRDLASQTKLKLRKPGQHAPEEIQKVDLKAELLRLEARKRTYGSHHDNSVEGSEDKATDTGRGLDHNTDQDVEDSQQEHESGSSEQPRDSKDHKSDKASNDSDEEDEDMEALLLELEKIKKEREAEREKQAQQEAKSKFSLALSANPLYQPQKGSQETSSSSGGGAFVMKRRWDEDVIFKGQQKRPDGEVKKRYINDTIRSDFHRKFLDRYIR